MGPEYRRYLEDPDVFELDEFGWGFYISHWYYGGDDFFLSVSGAFFKIWREGFSRHDDDEILDNWQAVEEFKKMIALTVAQQGLRWPK